VRLVDFGAADMTVFGCQKSGGHLDDLFGWVAELGREPVKRRLAAFPPCPRSHRLEIFLEAIFAKNLAERGVLIEATE